MAFRNFRLQVILRFILFALLLWMLFHLLIIYKLVITSLFVLFLLVALAVESIRYIEKNYRNYTAFLQAVRQNDFTLAFPETGAGNISGELNRQLNLVVKTFQKLKAEKEAHHNYLQTVIEHVKVALIAYNEKGEVHLYNKAAEDLLHKAYITNIQGLEHIDRNLFACLREIRAGEKQLISASPGGKQMQVAVYATEFTLMETNYKLVSLHNIRPELEEKEVEAWQKLIRVLTHEIINSLTPITSLAGASQLLLEKKDGDMVNGAQLSDDDIAELHYSFKTIGNRSNGLVSFVKAYRNYAQLSRSNHERMDLAEAVSHVFYLLKPEMERRNIQFSIALPSRPVFITGDRALLEQVFINLALNARDAVQARPSPSIRMEVRTSVNNEDMAVIEVSDNGPGIPDEIKDNIFVPFFTTKEKGNGIGLAISKQIINQHKGELHFSSNDCAGTTFVVGLKTAASVPG